MLLFPFLYLVGIGLEATENDEVRNAIFMAAVPSIMIVLLVPVLFKGSLGQRIAAWVLLIPAGGLCIIGWMVVIDFVHGH
jgi:hypothetical protein